MGIDIDGLLRVETTLLIGDAKRMGFIEFSEFAKKEDLRQEDWSRFWKTISNIKLSGSN